MRRLRDLGIDITIKEFVQKKAGILLGICVGMQVLFEYGYENNKESGLGFIPGEVKLIKLNNYNLKIPHVGWNNVNFIDNKLSSFNGDYYFTHSFTVYTDEKYITGVVEYGELLTASVSNGLVQGFQFHPEKSGSLGLNLLNHYCSEILHNA
jgi:glutamine amidotransferase